MKLTKTQKFAVEASGKNILVSAGAGTGKTRVLVERFLYLVTTHQAAVTEILALTFTEKAANEMKSRILERLSQLGLGSEKRQLEGAYISTMHAFAARILKEHPIEAGVDPAFSVIEAEESDFLKEQALDEVLEKECLPGSGTFELVRLYGESSIRAGVMKILRAARHEGKTLAEFFENKPADEASQLDLKKTLLKLNEAGLAAEWNAFETKKDWTWREVENFKTWFKPFARKGGKGSKEHWRQLSRACQAFLGKRLDDLARPWREKLEALASAFETAYESRKSEKGYLDFDDLERLVLRLFCREDAASRKLLAKYRERFRWIMVDEFQDTNYLQLKLIEALSRGDNLFLVGDYKQSIYAFRGAEPAVFLEKEKEYRDGERGVKIPLLENFRTQERTLNFINAFFKNLWSEDPFQFEELIARLDGQEQDPVELLTVPVREGEGLEQARTREARGIAERIQELRAEGVSYGDIAVLFQAMTSTHIYEYALKQAGIPYFVISGRGFYHQSEIRDLVNFLSFLENPLSDIPLAACLRSPFFQITDDTLFWLAHVAKQKGEWTPLYEGIRHFEEIAEIPQAEKEKLRFFKSVSDDLQAQRDRLRLTELLDRILEKTSYDLMVLADSQGVRRYANLKKLVQLAREYEAHEPLPLGQFLRTLKRLETNEVRESEAQVEAEKSGKVVRLLTVHRAKGLEFPVVFVADLARQGQSSESKTVVAEAGSGYGLQVINTITGKTEKPGRWLAIDGRIQSKENDEWKRLFYVAATRAKQKLILSGVEKSPKQDKENYRDMSSWMEWIRHTPEAILKSVQKRSFAKTAGHGSPRKALAEKKEFLELFSDFQPQSLERLIPKKEARDAVLAEGDLILSKLQSPERRPARSIDLPVSAYTAYLKSPAHYRLTFEIGYPDTGWSLKQEDVPFEDEIDRPADFGTAMHAVLERMDFQNPRKSLEENLEEAFRLFEADALVQARTLIEKFLTGPLYGQLKQAKMVRRELPFVLNERHGAIHGVIDLLYQDAGGAWHVVDYKTAEGSAEKVREAGYELQIKMYAYAVAVLLGQEPVSATVYFLKNQWQHRLDINPGFTGAFETELRALQDRIMEHAGSV